LELAIAQIYQFLFSHPFCIKNFLEAHTSFAGTWVRPFFLADEVGTPDGCRFWDRKAYLRGEFLSLDKDVFRKNKGDLSAAYLEIYNRITKINNSTYDENR